MGHNIIKEVSQEKYEFNGRSKMIAIGLFVVGIVLASIGAMQVKSGWDGADSHHATEHAEEAHDDAHDEAHHSMLADNQEGHADNHGEEHAASHDGHGKTWMSRVWANLLLNSYYFWAFAVAALFFMAVQYVANAGWATMLKRIMEAQSHYLIVGSVILLAVVILGRETFYHWVVYFKEGHTEGSAGFDAILESKSWLLNNGSIFFLIPFVLIVWVLIRAKLRANSLKEDTVGGLDFFRNSTRWSAGFIFFFAFSFSALAWLIIMSIDSHWYSTMFSVYNFAMSFVTGLSMMMLILIYLKSKGYMEMVSNEVVHDLGKFMFAFCVFWGYIFLGQWLLIWYANLPEETVYFAKRLTPYYRPLFFTNIILCFLAPFLVLMMRNAKRMPIILASAASIILIGHWVDVYLMIMPGVVEEKAGIGLLEIGTTIAFAGIFIFVVLRSLSKANIYPQNHPYLLESANHDVGP